MWTQTFPGSLEVLQRMLTMSAMDAKSPVMFQGRLTLLASKAKYYLAHLDKTQRCFQSAMKKEKTLPYPGPTLLLTPLLAASW